MGELGEVRLVLCGICCILVCFLVVGVNVYAIVELNKTLVQVASWERPQDWRSTACKVISVGVACTEKDAHSTCGGLGGKGINATPSGPFVFGYQDLASCPGGYWCAKEGDVCFCRGKVKYAPELFNGNLYTSYGDPGEFEFEANGNVTCGHGKDGQPFARDPSPYHVKHCWCTPQGLLDRIQTLSVGAIQRDPRQCAADDSADYTSVNARRLAGDAPSPEPPEEDPPSEDDDDDEGDDSTDLGDAEEDESPAPARSLTSSPRRRRTYAYTPWALVVVPPVPDNGFGIPESQEPVITCAYEYGVPEASYGNYQSDGPSGGWLVDNLKQAKAADDVAHGWAQAGEAPCQVRTSGKAGTDTCAVAMTSLSDLQELREKDLHRSWLAVWIFGLAGVLLTACGVAAVFMASATGKRPGFESLEGDLL